jgi:hypothetical protein
MQDIVQWDYGSWPDGLPKKGGANALSGAGSLDTATTCLSKTSRTKNFIIELKYERDLWERLQLSLNETEKILRELGQLEQERGASPPA